MKNKKIVLAAGVYPPQIGGPAKYAKNLHDEFVAFGYDVHVVSFVFEHKLPPILRHVWYFVRLLRTSFKSDAVLAFDSFSTGLPAMFVGKILHKKVIIRIGGDFLWETHVDQNQTMIPLPYFYKEKGIWCFRDKIVFYVTRFVLHHVGTNVFNSKWLESIFKDNYSVSPERSCIIGNVFQRKERVSNQDGFKKFLFAGRSIALKNTKILNEIFLDIKKDNPEVTLEILTGVSRDVIEDKIKSAYALILPSLSDVMPNFIMEGLEYGKPFVMTKYTGIKDVFGVCGEFVDPLDKDSIKTGILNMLDEQKYQMYVSNIQNINITNSWQDITNDFIKIIEK